MLAVNAAPARGALGARSVSGHRSPSAERWHCRAVPAGKAPLRPFVSFVSQGLFPPSCVPFSSLLACVGIPASSAFSKHFCAAAAGQRQKAELRHLSRAASPETARPSERDCVRPVTTRGFSGKALRRPWVFLAASRGGDLLPADVHKDLSVGTCWICAFHSSITERQQLIRQNRTLEVFSLGYIDIYSWL